MLTDLDDVIDLDRSFYQKYQARHEIIDYILQSKADADANSAGDQGEPRKIDPDDPHRYHESNNKYRIMKHRRYGVGDTSAEPDTRIDIFLEDEPHKPGDQDRDPDHKEEKKHGPKRKRDGPDGRGP